jgi:hypothetical protein
VEAVDQDALIAMKPGTFARDPHLNDLVVFAGKTDLHENPQHVVI